MKKQVYFLFSLGVTLALGLSGCGKSNDTASTQPPAAPSAPETKAETTVTEPTPPQASAAPSTAEVKKQVEDTAKAASAAVAEVGNQLLASIKEKSDPVLTDVTKDLTARAEALKQSLTSEEALKDYLQKGLSYLTDGNDQEAMGIVNKISEAKLTTEQTKLFTELKDTVSAFVVQRNFASLEGAQGEVGKIVTALRAGDSTTALANLKEVATKVNLTPNQKDLVNSLVTQYAPALKDAGKALQEGVKGLNPFGK